MKNMCTKIVELNPFSSDLLFYKELAGQINDTDGNKIIFNQFMTIFVTKMRQRKKGHVGEEYAPSSIETKLKRLFSCFKDKGIPWKQEDFGKPDDWLSILNTRINKLKKEVPGYGHKKVAEIDEDGDDKFISALEDGTLQPYANTDDLFWCLVALLGRVLGYRGGKEIALAMWSDFEFREPTEKLPLPSLYSKPGEGWDKRNQLAINKNVYVRND